MKLAVDNELEISTDNDMVYQPVKKIYIKHKGTGEKILVKAGHGQAIDIQNVDTENKQRRHVRLSGSNVVYTKDCKLLALTDTDIVAKVAPGTNILVSGDWRESDGIDWNNSVHRSLEKEKKKD
jgi:hypothetical protein